MDDLGAAGLPVPCVVRTTKIACIEEARIRRRSGTLSADAMEHVIQNVRSFLDQDVGP